MAAAIAFVALLSACDRGTEGFGGLIGVGVCDPERTTFTLEIDNPFMPLEAGRVVELRSDDGVYIRISALEETETVVGISTRVVVEHEELDGRLVESTRNFFAQNANGDVCYFGEEVDVYAEDGSVSSHSGSWRADGDLVRPGMFMPAQPRVGMAFRQELAPGVAEDQGRVVALGETARTPAGEFDDTVTITDLNPLDGSTDAKIYARGIGLIRDEAALLASYTTSNG